MSKEHPIWHSFVRSNYITAVWNWFLMLAGKAAEAVLTASVVYSCARLLPAVHPPAALDNTVFVMQMVALDVGGLSLRKLANQARKDGNESGALFAGRVSTALISIMIANVALSVIQAITPISAQFIAVVEGMLLVARAIMAVLYAHVIHSLRDDSPLGEQSPQPSEIEQVTAKIEQIATEQQRLAGMIQPVSYDALMTQIQAQIDAKMTQPAIPQNASSDAPKPAQNDAPKSASKPASRPPQNASGKVIKMRQSSASQDIIHKLLDKDTSLSSYELARQAKCSEATARRIKNRYLETHSDASNDALGKASV